MPTLLVLAATFGATCAWLTDEGLGAVAAQNRLYEQLRDPQAFEKYCAGEIDPSRVVLVRPDRITTPWGYAEHIQADDAHASDLVEQIAPQAGVRGDRGVDPSDFLVLNARDIDPRAIGNQLVRLSVAC